MSLTGTLLPLVLGAAALVLFVVLVRDRGRRRGHLALLLRSAQLLGLNLLTIALCSVVLNDRYLFYVTWSDLVGGYSPAAVSVVRGAHEPVRADLPPQLHFRPVTSRLAPLPQPGSRLQTYIVTGSRSGVTGQILVELPKGYDPAAHRTYPVVEALHGWPGGPTAVNREIDLPGAFQRLQDDHALAATIVVMPQINTPTTLDTECVNAPAGTGPQTLTWLGTDVPQWAADHFRVADKRTAWLALGASYGGWCAANVGMHYPRVFGGAVSFMGYFAPEFYGYKPFANDPARLQTYDLTRMAATSPPPISLWAMASKEDHGAYRALVPFLKAARAPLAVTAYVLQHGGHNVATIPPTLPSMAAWLVHALPGFAARG